MRLAMTEPKDDPTAPFTRAILELFREDLRAIRFPDLDHDSLMVAAEELSAAQLEVECIEAALQGARELVRERARLLSEQATRALSYARIYAAGNPALSARIKQLDLLAPDAANAAQAPVKKRRRSRKESTGAQLFASEGAQGSKEEEAAA
jgi:hypothetical protein